jgi:hypothetical protein
VVYQQFFSRFGVLFRLNAAGCLNDFAASRAVLFCQSFCGLLSFARVSAGFTFSMPPRQQSGFRAGVFMQTTLASSQSAGCGREDLSAGMGKGRLTLHAADVQRAGSSETI